MKNFLSIVCIFSVVAALAQSPTRRCGTEMTESYRQHYYTKNMDYLYAPSSNRGGTLWVPIAYHIITRDDGSGGVSLRHIYDSHCELNEAFNQFGIGFFISVIDSIRSTSLYNNPNVSGWSTFSNYNIQNKCNVYISPDLDVCGFATYPNSAPKGGGIFINRSCYGAGTTTLHHEMGHFLDLPHTFEPTVPVEYVNGSNCATKGDRFCDTPADFIDYRAPCPYTGNETDPNGDFYKNVIDETLYMSYFYDQCTNRFSPMQQTEMIQTLNVERPELLNQTTPDLNPLPAPVFISPTNGDTTILAGSYTFRWKKVNGAVCYRFRLQLANSNLFIADTIVADTTFTFPNILPNKTYLYRVKAVSWGNTCGNYTPLQSASTSSLTINATVQSPSCGGDADGSITVTPINGVQPFSYQWSNGSTTSSTGNVPAGIYSLTITDAAGEVAVGSFTLKNPEPLVVSIQQVGFNLNAYTTGGTPPYSYSWNNGEIFSSNNNLTPGTYSVTVTDSKGCQAEQSYTIWPTDLPDFSLAGISIYPNPIHSGEVSYLQLTALERVNITLQIYDMRGAALAKELYSLPAGTHRIPLPVGNLPKGVYTLYISTSNTVSTWRITAM
ncbi:MAG: T9SS type A sorting domain-containing protein [Chitinophagales bacterium]|nr:T9SS type A sorting domain-containing protein [Chitinophagales bacterium]MDW8418388.1 T9SS type A sorting domain-containing protein [Chitinophagales bacterium]